jgi:membrane-bound inhibitor of C-type lysozyme
VQIPSRFKALAICVLALPLAACLGDDDDSSSTPSALIIPPMMNTRPATFKCDNTGSVVVRPVGEDGKTITLATRTRDIQLRQVPANEGRKYSDGQTVIWINGENATLLMEGDETPESCGQS